MKRKFSIIQQFVGFEDGVSMQLADIRCDKEADIPEPRPEWCVGSTCFIVETQEVKFLNSEGEWE